MNVREHSKINISESEAHEIENSYNELLDMLKKLSGETEAEVVSKGIADLIDFIMECLSSKGNGLLLYTSRIFDKDYIFAHSLNVCLISLKIGLTLRFDKERLKDLGSLALTHAKEDMKFPKELLKKKEHDKELDAIVRLVDVYDALTHAPIYRHEMTPYDTLTSLINTDKFFDRRLIKILLQELSLYPKGSWVQLSTHETGRVIKVNKELLLRPTVRLLKGKYQKEPRTVDLSKNNALYIRRPLTEKEINHIKEAEISL